MKVIKKWRVLQVETKKINDDTIVELWELSDRYTYLSSVHNTKKEALEEAFKAGKYGNYIVVPQYSFDNHSNDDDDDEQLGSNGGMY